MNAPWQTKELAEPSQTAPGAPIDWGVVAKDGIVGVDLRTPVRAKHIFTDSHNRTGAESSGLEIGEPH
jgi:hypothetical protein